MGSVGHPKGIRKQMQLYFSASWFVYTHVSARQLTLQHEELAKYIAGEFENILDAFFPDCLGNVSCSIRSQRKRPKHE